MCGIYGTNYACSDELVRAKLKRIRFRGPDYSAFTKIDRVILGHNRLAIVDLDARSNQPFAYAHVHIVFNGEIYNYRDIKTDLIRKGHSFTTQSDTEVICAAYLEYGVNCLNHFNGMFAFVIYDTVKQTLFGARDRLGKKPFYYSNTGLGFEFASQPAAIAIGRDVTINDDAINEFLFWNYIPETSCIYKEVKKLPAGAYLTYDLNKQTLVINQYWDISSEQKMFTGSYEDAKEQLQEILDDAVKIRMNADVPLGVFLSSGIDSSLIAAIALKHDSRIRTFNVKFDEKKFDESKDTKIIASYLGTNHYTIDCNYQEGIKMISSLPHFYDEPFADSSALPSLLLAKNTKHYVTVALTGDGGDESFLGYSRYRWMDQVKNIYTCPLILRKAGAWLLALSPSYRHKLIAMGLKQKNLVHLYLKLCGGMDHTNLLKPHPGDNAINSPWLNSSKNPLLKRISDHDIKTYLNDDINTKVDRATMAYAVESRAPLMDYRVVEFARSLPVDFMLNNKVQKRILRDLLFKTIPESYYNRPKSGFSVPLEKWFRNELKELVLDTLSTENLCKIPGINVPYTQKMVQEHMSGSWNRSSKIWSLIVLIQWMEANNTSYYLSNPAKYSAA